jgi:hypothetical protein
MPHTTPHFGARSLRSGYLALCEPECSRDPISRSAACKARAGATLPVKWRALDPTGAPVSDRSHFAGLTSTIAQEEDRAGGTGPQYLGDGYWQFDWQTPATYAGQLRIMTLALRDGSTRTALLDFT